MKFEIKILWPFLYLAGKAIKGQTLSILLLHQLRREISCRSLYEVRLESPATDKLSSLLWKFIHYSKKIITLKPSVNLIHFFLCQKSLELRYCGPSLTSNWPDLTGKVIKGQKLFLILPLCKWWRKISCIIGATTFSIKNMQHKQIVTLGVTTLRLSTECWVSLCWVSRFLLLRWTSLC